MNNAFFAEKYTDFKDNIHQLFPTVYDTKFLSFELRELLSTERNLQNYYYLKTLHTFVHN